MPGTKTIVTKKPPYKETIGAQYYTFNNPGEGIDFDLTRYEEETNKTETVKSVTITESTESTPIYASGKVYDTKNQIAYTDIEVSSIANDADDLAKMRGDKVNTNGLIQGQAEPKRPFFAYGKVVKLSGDNFRFDWYPKCQLVENSDEASTKEQSFAEQNESLTIRAYAFDEAGKLFKNSIDSSSANFPAGITEEMFFRAPITGPEDLDALIAEVSTDNEDTEETDIV